MSLSYKDAGVDKEEAYDLIEKLKSHVKTTHNSSVISGIGSFGAFYELGKYNNPVLVSGTDGVGTKIRIALDTKKYDGIGIDCFAMCANDILCHGAKPLFFLDYLACGELDANIAFEIVKGMTKACKTTGTALIGGETAEMPGMYQLGDYDIAGFVVGIVEKDDIINGSTIVEGDIIIGLPSNGFHSNGFSLVRKVFTDYFEIFEGKELYHTLLEPTRLYQNTILNLIEKVKIKGLAHITGGGLIENLPRILPENMCAVIDYQQIVVPTIMKLLQNRASVNTLEMLGTFNMGVGMTIVVSKDNLAIAESTLKALGEKYMMLGRVQYSSNDKIKIENID